jgi:CrcB protein
MSQPPHHDLIDEPALPRLGLSAATILAIFLGGALGTLSRYLLGAALPTAPNHFPSATLFINLSGSLLIGLLIPLTEHLAPRTPALRPFALIGVLGGWTTYSTLAVDAEQLAQHGQAPLMLAYLAATLIGGIVAVLLGNTVGHRIVRP